jgi:hypothetical protein
VSLVHFHLKHHTVKQRKGGGGRAVRYLERTEEFAPDATRIVEYNERTSDRTKDYGDYRQGDVANLPSWAQGSAQIFFEAAWTKERANGRWATSLQANFPRELSLEQQAELTRDFVATHLPNRPTLWVIHEPIARDGLPQPHAHILFSERLMNDGLPERGPDVMFRRPEVGGCKKETFGRGDRQAPYRLREAWCAAVNDTVDRAGYGAESLMDPRSFHVRGITRPAVRYHIDPDAPDQMELTPPKDERTPEDRHKEQAMAQAWWTDYKRSMGITPAMDKEAVLQIIATEVRQPGTRAQQLAQERAVEPDPVRGDEQPFIGNVRSKIYHAPSDPNYGTVQPHNQVVFASHDAAVEAGYRAAVNQHYGPGGMERLQAQAQTLTHEIADLTTHAARLSVEGRMLAHREATGREVPAVTQERIAALLTHGEETLGLDRDLTHRWEKPLIGNRLSQIYHTPAHKNYGDVHPKNQVQFWTEQDAQNAGYRRAANDHYGRGTGQARGVEESKSSQRGQARKQGQPHSLEERIEQAQIRQASRGIAAAGALLEDDEVQGGVKVRLREKGKDYGYDW